MLVGPSKMGQRYDAVLGVVSDDFTVTEVAKKFGASRPTIHARLARCEKGGLEVLVNRSARHDTTRHIYS